APLAMPGNVSPDVESRDAPAAPAADPAPPAVPHLPSERDTRNAEPGSAPKERTPQELVMAALAVAEQMTSAEPPKAIGHDHTDETKTDETKADETKADAAIEPPAPNVDSLVAVVIARPNVGSATALKDHNVAIEKAEASHEAVIRFALVAAGATGT